MKKRKIEQITYTCTFNLLPVSSLIFAGLPARYKKKKKKERKKKKTLTANDSELFIWWVDALSGMLSQGLKHWLIYEKDTFPNKRCCS